MDGGLDCRIQIYFTTAVIPHFTVC